MNTLLKVLEKAFENDNEIVENAPDAFADLHAVPLENKILAAQNSKDTTTTT